MNLIIFGPPGAGKGTQGELLAQRHGLVRLATGDLLREALKAGTPLGLEARKFMDAGELVPDDVILGLVREVMEGKAAGRGVLFDGFPRTLEQAQGLEKVLREINRPLEAVIVLDVSDETLVKRLSGRLYCPNCGAVYNRYFNPPPVEGVCGVCSGALVQRADDAPDTVRRRLEVYRSQTQPLIAYFERSGVAVHYVNGDRKVDDVQTDLLRLVGGG
jgi:adenylate kinase